MQIRSERLKVKQEERQKEARTGHLQGVCFSAFKCRLKSMKFTVVKTVDYLNHFVERVSCDVLMSSQARYHGAWS